MKTKTIVVRCDAGDEYYEGISYALVVLTQELVRYILSLRKTFLALKAQEAGLYEVSFWDPRLAYYRWFDDDEAGVPGACDRYAEAPEGFTPPAEEERSECDRLVLREDGFYWTCYPKNFSVSIDTVELPYELLEGLL